MGAFALAFLAGIAAPAGADGSQEADLAARVNAVRTSRGLNALIVDSGISSVARNWASQIAANGALSHNPNLANELPPGWTDMGENVAFGPDTATIERDLESDPPHYANLVNPRFTHLGVGVVEVNGRLWAVQDFAGYGSASPSSAGDPYAWPTSAPSGPPPTVAPAPTAVTTTTTAVAAVSAAAATAPATVTPSPPPAPAAPTAARGVGQVAFTGGRFDRPLRVAATVLVLGFSLLVVAGLRQALP